MLTHSSETNSWSHSLHSQAARPQRAKEKPGCVYVCGVGGGVSEEEEQCEARRWHCKGAVVTGDLTA